MKVRRGDTHSVYWQVTDEENGGVVDITGSTAKIHLSKQGVAPIILTGVVEAPQKRIRHDLTGLVPTGTYALEIELTDGAGKITTVPTEKNDTFTVVEDIA